MKSFLKGPREYRLLAAIILSFLGFTSAARAQSSTLVVTPPSLTFTGMPGSIFPKSLTVYTVGSSVLINITASSGQGWLGVSTNQITATGTQQSVGVIVNDVALAPGNNYDGTITFSGMGIETVVVDVTLNVTSGSAYTASPATLNFSSTVGGPQQSTPLSIATTNTTLTPLTIQATTTTGSGWLTVTPQSGSVSAGPGLGLTVYANPGGLTVGSYTGAINIYANGASTSTLSVPVNFMVNPQATGLLAANPSPLSFNFVDASSPAQSQQLTVSTTSNLVEPVTLTPSPSSSWLSVGGNTLSTTTNVSANFPSQVSVSVNPSGLTASSYNGQITLSNTDLGEFVVPVQVNVGSASSSQLTAAPDPINVTVASGSASVVNQQLTVTHGPSGFNTVSFIASTSQPSGQNWLSVNPTSVQMVGTSGNVVLTVSINPQGLSSGVYDASAVVLTPVSGGTPLTIPVNLTVGGAPTIALTPPNLTFAYQTATATPPGQTVDVTSTGTFVGFTVTAASAGNWLMVNPSSGATSVTPGAPSPLTVQVNPAGLVPNIYQGTVQVASSTASNSPQTVNVTLQVSNQAVLTPSIGNVIFNYQYQSGILPPPQNVYLTSSGNAIPYTASFSLNSGGDFASVSPSSGTSPGAITVSANPAQLATLAPGQYQGTVELLSSTAGNSPINVGVILIVGNDPVIVPSQTSFGFNYEVGKSLPTNQTLALTSSGETLAYNATATSVNCGGNFLSVANPNGNTPGAVALSASVSDAPPGICNGAVTVTAAGAANSPLTIPVTLAVSNTPLLNASPAYIALTTHVGTSPASQAITLTGTDPSTAIAFNVTSAANGGNWLQVQPTSGSTPLNLSIGFQTSSLAAGTYTGTVTVTPIALGATPTVIPIQVVVTSSTSSAATPASLTFNQAFGGASPASQTIQISSSTSGLGISAAASVASPAGGNWLSVATGSGSTTPGILTVSVNGSNLGEGNYSGVITVQIPQASPSVLLIPVNLVIGPPVGILASPTSVSFTSVVGATSPPGPQSVTITSVTGSPVAFTTASSSNLFTVTPGNGNTPQTLAIGVNAGALAALAASSTPYTGTIMVNSPLGNLAITASLTLQASLTPVLGSVVNGASDVAGAVSPGEIISIYGTNIGPSTPAYLTLTSAGKVSTSLAGASVTFNGVAAPLTYVASGQINAIVPYEVSGGTTTSVVVNFNDAPSPPITLNVTPTAPAIFSLSQGGSGQGAILNQDFSVNGASNPAAKGSYISIYATGEGALSPQPPTGSVTPANPPYPMPVATPVSVTIGGQPAAISYAGEAPGLVSGVLQVNVQIPSKTGSGPQTVVLTVGTATNAQQNITVAVQ